MNLTIASIFKRIVLQSDLDELILLMDNILHHLRLVVYPIIYNGFVHPRWWSPDIWTINTIFVHFCWFLVPSKVPPVPSGPLFLLHPNLAMISVDPQGKGFLKPNLHSFKSLRLSPPKMHPHENPEMKFQVQEMIVKVSLKKNHIFLQPFTCRSNYYGFQIVSKSSKIKTKRGWNKSVLDTPNSLHKRTIQPWPLEEPEAVAWPKHHC